MIHGMVDRPLTFTMDELKRLPYVSRIHFIECQGNRARATHKTVQDTHGLTSCAEWTGVPLSLLLKEAGLQNGASWIMAEGAEEVKGASSIPLAKALDDCLVVYGMNGEPLRPQQGFPLRLLVPGFEGIYQIRPQKKSEPGTFPSAPRERNFLRAAARPSRVRGCMCRRGARDATARAGQARRLPS